jgi:hypothetical protein
MSRKNGGIIGPANTPVGGLITGLAGGVWRMNDVANFVGNSQWPLAPENIDNSLRFNSGSSDNLSKSLSTPTNDKKFTFSCWFKKSKNATEMNLFGYQPSGNAEAYIGFSTSDEIRYADRDSGDTTAEIFLVSNAKLRDVSAWYHVVVSVDTTQGTDSNRAKLYLNGEQITSLANSTYPSQNYTPEMNSSDGTKVIGADNNGNYFNGYIAETVFIDGQQLDPTSFGEFDTTTGIWKPKKIGQIANAGTNSFYLDFKDSSNVGNDASGLSNNFTVNNLTSIDQSTDTCVVNYATLNPLFRKGTSTPAFTEGNLKSTFDDSGANEFALTTFGVDTGKWYAEVKWTSAHGNSATATGILDMAYTGTADPNNAVTNAFGYFGNGNKNVSGTASSYGASYTSGDIIGIALNCDDNQVTFYKNGSSQGVISIIAGVTYGIFASDYDSKVAELNTGSPSFSISSGNSDANGFGNFEYSVPSGYYALNTSNLNTYG